MNDFINSSLLTYQHQKIKIKTQHQQTTNAIESITIQKENRSIRKCDVKSHMKTKNALEGRQLKNIHTPICRFKPQFEGVQTSISNASYASFDDLLICRFIQISYLSRSVHNRLLDVRFEISIDLRSSEMAAMMEMMIEANFVTGEGLG